MIKCRTLFEGSEFLFFVVFLSCFGTSIIRGQENDFKLWTDIELEKEIGKKFEMELSFSNRLHENATRREETHTSLSFDYSKKWFSAGIIYRVFNESDPERGYDLGHRVTFELGLDKDLDRFKFSTRNRYQAEYTNVNSSAKGKIPKSHYRNRIKIDYNVKSIPIEPYFFYEFYYRLNSYAPKEIDKYRFSGGLDIKLNKHNSVNLGYINQYYISNETIRRDHIVEIKYSFSI